VKVEWGEVRGRENETRLDGARGGGGWRIGEKDGNQGGSRGRKGSRSEIWRDSG